MSTRRFVVSALVVVAAGIAGTKFAEGPGPVVNGEAQAYVDKQAKSRVVTICYGHTGGVKLGDKLPLAACDALLLKDLNEKYAPAVRRLVKVPLSQGEFNALVDFVYNLGEGNFAGSTLLKKVNRGDYAGAALEFEKWMFTDGKDCRLPESRCGGIPKRRAWQKAMFLS